MLCGIITKECKIGRAMRWVFCSILVTSVCAMQFGNVFQLHTSWKIHNTTWKINNTTRKIHNTTWEIHNTTWKIRNTTWKIHNTTWKIHNTTWGINNATQEINNTTAHTPSRKTNFSMLQWWGSNGINQTIYLPKNLTSFKSMLNLEQHGTMRKLFFRVAKLLQDHKIQYLLAYGTLIGAYRHYGIIPWDDDFDIYVNFNDNDRISSLFHGKKPVMIDNLQLTFKPTLHKFSKITIEYVWTNESHREKHGGWPFIDVFFFTDDDKNVQDLTFKHVRFDTNRIFPLQLWPFEGTLQPVPRDINHVTNVSFSEDVLSMCKVSHRHYKRDNDPPLVPKGVPCAQLYPYYPFAIKSKNGYFISIGNRSLVLSL